MINIFKLSESIRLVIVLFLGISIIAQTITILLSYYQKGFGRQDIFNHLFELIILFFLIVLNLMLAYHLNAFKISLFSKTPYINLRIIVFALIILLSTIILYKNKKKYIMLVLISCMVLIPQIERLLERYYPLAFILSILAIIARSLILSVTMTKAINKDISAFSIIHAINTLNTGLLYSQNNGQILIINNMMHELMLTLTGKIYRNSIDFYDFITYEKYNSNFEKVYLDKQVVYVLPNSKAYMFTKQEVLLNNKTFIHISASDVSTQMALSKRLKKQNLILEEKSTQIKNTIDNLYKLSHTKELENIRSRTHDILGQHLSFMLRTIDSSKDIDYQILKSVSKGLLSELVKEKNIINYCDQLKNIQSIFLHIGVKITVLGEFPENNRKSELILDVIRESTTNAVRHGLATEININLDKMLTHFQVNISNNGFSPESKIKFGSGLNKIQQKVIQYGGILNIKQQPYFTIKVILPGGE